MTDPHLTLTWSLIETWYPCLKAVAWGYQQFDSAQQPTVAVLHRLIRTHHEDWANWLIVRCMTYKQSVRYAIFAAEQVVELYERQDPGDFRVRHAIDAAKRCLTR